VQTAEADFLFVKAVKGEANCVPEFSTTGNPRPKLDLVAEVAPFSFKNHDFAYFYTSKWKLGLHNQRIHQNGVFRTLIMSAWCRPIFWLHVFTALHGIQTRSCDENSVRPSAKRVNCDKTEEKICLDFYTTRTIIYPSFLRKRIIGGGDPFYLKFWVNRPALERNRRFWTDNRS